MWFERDKEFILKNYLLKKRLNGVIPRNKQMIEAAAKSVSKNEKIWWYELQGFIHVLTLAVQICLSPKDLVLFSWNVQDLSYTQQKCMKFWLWQFPSHNW